jgi:HEAT repeat protein
VRLAYLEALSHIRTPDAVATLIGTARDHPDRETRFAAVERLVVIGPHQAVSPLVAGLASADNAQVNRSAEALGRLGLPEAIEPLIAALETKHMTVSGGGQPAGSTSATFTPAGGGLSMGGGPKPKLVAVRNDRVLEALVALTGQNFEWEAAAWRAWLANERALPAGFDLRRS